MRKEVSLDHRYESAFDVTARKKTAPAHNSPFRQILIGRRLKRQHLGGRDRPIVGFAALGHAHCGPATLIIKPRGLGRRVVTLGR